MALSYQQIIEELRKKRYKPVYFLTGDEPYYIDRITDFIAENVLSADEKSFNLVILYGKDTSTAAVIDTAKRFPMMADYQVVIVKEAQNLDNIDNLIYYVEKPLNSTILVINYKYKKPDKRKALYKALEKQAVLFESKKIYDNKIPDWIDGYLQNRGYATESGVGMLLGEYLGNDLSKIVNELEKLIVVLPSGSKTITRPLIEKYTGFSKDYNIFELSRALTNKDILKANRIVNYFGKNQRDNHINLTISSLYFFFSKVLTYHFLKDRSRNSVASALGIKPYFVPDYQEAAKRYSPGKVTEIISTLREYDLKSKGYGNTTTDPGDLLKEMIYKILH